MLQGVRSLHYVLGCKSGNAFRDKLGLGDEACTTCGMRISGGTNQMLLCDGAGCDGAAHMQCLPVPLTAVPDGDWFCPSCSEKLPQLPTAKPMAKPVVDESDVARNASDEQAAKRAKRG